MPQLVSQADAGVRLDRFLADRRADLPYGAVQKALRQGRVTVDGTRERNGSRRLAPGERVALLETAARRSAPRPVASSGPALPAGLPRPNPRIPIAVLLEDGVLLAIDKAPGRVVEPGRGHPDDTIVNALVARLGPEAARALGEAHDWGLVHRLDRETSGVLLAAKTPAAHERLAEAFRRGEVEKEYLALVLGDLDRKRGRIELPLRERRNRQGRLHVEVARGPGGAVPAATRYEVRGRLSSPRGAWALGGTGELSLVAAFPETGRTHQVRVHLAAIGHPIAGDEEYGRREEARAFREAVGLPRLFLHAGALRLRHPESGEKLEIRSPLPEDLAGALRRLGGRLPASLP